MACTSGTTTKLLHTLKHLRDLGNTLIVVEHDEETMLEADHIIDVGPGAGVHGGNILCTGTAQQIMACENSITGQYLSGKKSIPLPAQRRIGQWGKAGDPRRPGEQFKKCGCGHPPGHADIGHRRFRLGQELR